MLEIGSCYIARLNLLAQFIVFENVGMNVGYEYSIPKGAVATVLDCNTVSTGHRYKLLLNDRIVFYTCQDSDTVFWPEDVFDDWKFLC